MSENIVIFLTLANVLCAVISAACMITAHEERKATESLKNSIVTAGEAIVKSNDERIDSNETLLAMLRDFSVNKS